MDEETTRSLLADIRQLIEASCTDPALLGLDLLEELIIIRRRQQTAISLVTHSRYVLCATPAKCFELSMPAQRPASLQYKLPAKARSPCDDIAHDSPRAPRAGRLQTGQTRRTARAQEEIEKLPPTQSFLFPLVRDCYMGLR